jgi:hypothetical protein
VEGGEKQLAVDGDRRHLGGLADDLVIVEWRG